MDTERRVDVTLGFGLAGLLPLAAAALLVPFRESTAAANLALALVLPVVAAAAVGGRMPGMVAAVVTAVTYDFFLTRPYLSMRITSRDDIETTALLFIVGAAVGTIAARGRHSRRAVEHGRSELHRIAHLAEMVASGAELVDVLRETEREITELLRLEQCRFETPPFSVDTDRPRLERNGSYGTAHTHRLTRTGFAFPANGLTLEVLAHGRPVGRFVLVPAPETGSTLEERVVAIALADQAGAAIASQPNTNERVLDA